MDSLPPWSEVQSMLLRVVLPGFAVGAGLLAGVGAATRSATGRMIGGALALAGGLALGNLTRGLLPWWSLELGWPALFPATLVAIGGGVFAALASAGGSARWELALKLITAAVCAFWLAPIGPAWPRLGFIALLFGASALNAEAFRRGGVQSPGRGALLALTIPWGAAAAIVLIHAASARFFDLAVLQTATLAGIGLIAALRKLEVAGLLTGPAVFFPALMLAGMANTFSEVPAASFILVALAPCARWSLRLPPLRRWSDRAPATAVIVAVVVPCAAAVILALRAESLDFGG